MWEATPLSELGTWDGKCFYKIKDGSRRCKLSIAGDTGAGRFGNRDELMAKISRGVSLTRQEKNELARGLCCLRHHSTEYIAREICQMWARQPAKVLVPLSPQQSEVQRLKAENEVLAHDLQSAKAMEKQFHDNWVGTFPQIESLKKEIHDLKQTLEETRHVSEVLKNENEFLTTKFGFRREAPPKSTCPVPTVTAETSMPVTPVKRTVSLEFDTSANTKIFSSPSFDDSGFFSSASTPDLSFSTKKAYSASPTRRHSTLSSSSTESIIPFEEDYEASDLGATNLSPKTPSSATANEFEVAASPSAAPIKVNRFSPYTRNLTPVLASAALQSTILRDLRQTDKQTRTVYGFRTSSTSPYVKIGVTVDFHRRMREHVKCGMVNRHLVFMFESDCARRVESLIHAHLGMKRRKEDVDKKNVRCKHGSHLEWFEASDETVDVVAKGWRMWMLLKPYQEENMVSTRTLKPEWRDKLSLVKNNHKEQDVWLDWLSSVVSGFIPDPATHLRAIPQVDVAPPMVLIIDNSNEINVEVKQEPDLETDIWSATPEAAHIPATITTLAAIEQLRTEAFDLDPQPLDISPQPVGAQLERLLINLLCTVIFLCWAGNLSFMQFNGFVVWASFVVWTQVGGGGMREVAQKYYAVEDVSDEEIYEQSHLAVMMRLTAPDVDEEVVEGSLEEKRNGVEGFRALVSSAEILEDNLTAHRRDQQLERFQSTGSDLETRVIPRSRVAKKSRTTEWANLPQDFVFTFRAPAMF